MKKSMVHCSSIHIECSNEEDKEFRIMGENYWSFDFYVAGDDVMDLLYQVLAKISKYNFKEYSVGVGEEDLLLSPNDLWTLESIDLCLDSNLKMNDELKLSLK